MKYYTLAHSWIEQIEGRLYKVGISTYAIDQLAGLQYLELRPEVMEGGMMERGEIVADVESTKICDVIQAPFSGKVVNINTVPGIEEIINAAPEGPGSWIFTMEAEEGFNPAADCVHYKDRERYEKYCLN